MCCYKCVLWCIYVLFYMGVCNIWVGWYMCVIREICKGRGVFWIGNIKLDKDRYNSGLEHSGIY